MSISNLLFLILDVKRMIFLENLCEIQVEPSFSSSGHLIIWNTVFVEMDNHHFISSRVQWRKGVYLFLVLWHYEKKYTVYIVFQLLIICWYFGIWLNVLRFIDDISDSCTRWSCIWQYSSFIYCIRVFDRNFAVVTVTEASAMPYDVAYKMLCFIVFRFSFSLRQITLNDYNIPSRTPWINKKKDEEFKKIISILRFHIYFTKFSKVFSSSH